MAGPQSPEPASNGKAKADELPVVNLNGPQVAGLDQAQSHSLEGKKLREKIVADWT